MKTYIVTTLSLMACLMASSELPLSRAFQMVTHDTNRVEMIVSNYGTFGHNPPYSYGCFWPKGSEHNYIYGAGIWFGTIDSATGDTLVTIGYIQSEFVPGLKGMDPNHPDAIIYINPENWPAPDSTFPMAPQDLVSHEDSWCCFNDCDSSYHMPGDTRPIGIEVYQTVYAWDLPKLEDMIFFIYEIKNVSGHMLKGCYFGICTDCDLGVEIGAGNNDIMSGIVGKWYVIDGESLWVDAVAYQWQEMEEPGNPPWWPGVIGFDLLQTPFDLQEGQDKDGDGIPDQYERDSSYYVNNLPPEMWDVDNDGVPDWRDASENPQLGMTALKRFTIDLWPVTDPERYMILAGYNFTTGMYEPYDTIPPDPDDQRFLMSSGPFDLEPDSIVTCIFAVVFAEWHDIYETPDTALVLIDVLAQQCYDLNWNTEVGIQEEMDRQPARTMLLVFPNPVRESAHVSFLLSKPGAATVSLYDVAGRLVRQRDLGNVQAGSHRIGVETKGLSRGMYFVVLETTETESSTSFILVR